MLAQRKGEPRAPIACLWGHVCSLSSIDVESKNLSLFNIVDQFNLPQGAFDEYRKTRKPILIPVSYEVVLHWIRTLDIDGANERLSFDFVIRLEDPKGNVLQEFAASATLEQQNRRVNYRVRTNALPISIPGVYWYKVELKQAENDEFGVVLCEFPVDVKVSG